jgi:hypothetical protein
MSEQPTDTRMVLQSITLPPYQFVCIALPTGALEWEVSYGPGFLPGRFASIEDAMRAALKATGEASPPSARDQQVSGDKSREDQ